MARDVENTPSVPVGFFFLLLSIVDPSAVVFFPGDGAAEASLRGDFRTAPRPPLGWAPTGCPQEAKESTEGGVCDDICEARRRF